MSVDLGVCLHEAAHAVTAHAFDIPVARVFIDASGSGATVMGRSLAEALAVAPEGDGFPAGAVRAALIDLCVTIAGPVAESLLPNHVARGWERIGCDVDCHERAALRVAEACGVVASAAAWPGMVIERTRAFLDREWDAVERVALALATAHELSGARVVELAGRVDPPDLRDATSYARHLWRRHSARRERVA